MKDNYHHEDLKRKLIETSIEIISGEGFESLSLRKVSSKCGVSHNAVYRHFESKEQLIHTCQEYVMGEFVDYLNERIVGVEDINMRIRELSFAYVEFYEKHPTYYSALYRNSYTGLNITLDEKTHNYPPYEIFREQFRRLVIEKNISDEYALIKLIGLWSLLNGMTTLIISANVQWDGDWRKCLDMNFNIKEN